MSTEKYMNDFDRWLGFEGLAPDICHVTIKNICASAFCAIVRLLNQGGVPLHDITVDGVYDMAMECPYLDHGLYTVRVGDMRLYGDRHSTEDETYNIAIRNVRGAGDYVISLAGATKNLSLYGIEGNYRCTALCPNRKIG